MDEMKIVSKFTTNMISKLVKKVLRKRPDIILISG